KFIPSKGYRCILILNKLKWTSIYDYVPLLDERNASVGLVVIFIMDAFTRFCVLIQWVFEHGGELRLIQPDIHHREFRCY
ncbi:hypothetical protein, partial [Leclercia adecarboxylata]|uniref:hypothetical protein n=1 Tax=Leclercia adecarboxylata TaxID=83655 RepID=UPI001F228094